MLRSSVGNYIRKARFAAVFGIVAFIDLPLVFISARVMRGVSPVVFGGSGGGIEPKMMVALVASLVAFSFLFVVLLKQRYDIEKIGYTIENLKGQEA